MEFFRQLPILAALVAITLAGCGGGGGGGGGDLGSIGGGGGGSGGASASAGNPSIQILSSDPSYVSGGDTLVSVVAPAAASAKDIVLKLNGTDITNSLAYDAKSNSMRGLVGGLKDGANKLDASLKNGGSVTLALKNFPKGGPIFSGPQQQPWTCINAKAGLAAPTDSQCNAPVVYQYFYKSNATGKFAAYDPATPPAASDIATTTTDQGVTVPYIVRQENGMIDRVNYKIAVLFDPSKVWSVFEPQASWNHKLYVPLFGGFGKNYDSGAIFTTASGYPNGDQDAMLNDMALKRGFAVAKTVFLQPATHTDPVRAAESLMMLKELIRKNYGSIRYTFSSGASGGSFTQNQLANSYPGLLQGIIPMANFVDYWSATDQESHDCTVMERYYAMNPTLWADPAQRLAAEGNGSPTNCQVFSTTFPAALAADGFITTNVSASAAYNATTNPTGVRQTYQDYHVNYLGRRTQDVWTNAEKAAGFGFARSHRDNVGIQYGLLALSEGRITPEQFVHLNENVGGLDIDFKSISTRTVQDAGIASTMYRTGGINDTFGLNTVPIIAVRLPDPDPVASHEIINSFIQRDRLRKMHGNSDNYVLWIIPGYEYMLQHELSFVAMDRWLTAIEADTSNDSLSTKVVKNKPADIASGCWNPADASNVQMTNEVKDLDLCTNNWYPISNTPRTIAAMGSRDSTFVTKCQLKPLSMGDYNVSFSPTQWARLQAAFPGGVCDWSKADAGLAQSVPWLDYSGGPSGTPMIPPVEPQ